MSFSKVAGSSSGFGSFFLQEPRAAGGGLFEESERRLVRKLFAEIAEALCEHSFDTVYRAVDFADAIGFHAPSYNAGQRCVYGGGRPARLSYDSISDEFVHILKFLSLSKILHDKYITRATHFQHLSQLSAKKYCVNKKSELPSNGAEIPILYFCIKSLSVSAQGRKGRFFCQTHRSSARRGRCCSLYAFSRRP